MPTQNNQCLDTKYLQQYLAEELDAGADSDVAQHIDACPSCQRSLEKVAADEDAWIEARTRLLKSSTFVNVEPESPSESRDRELEQLTKFLGPTDDPNMMGRLGRYEVVGLIGRGSTGMVVKALEPQLNRFVAIKILSPMYSSNGAARSRFEREARSVAAVINENVVPIYAVDDYQGLPYLVMQYISGGSLLQRIEKQGPLETCEVARVGMQVARGLAAAHEQGIVHRDVKPANVMLEDRVERAMVTDFGLARVADEAAMTRSGVIAGTPQFMSPEQAKGEPVDPRSDLFSLGSVLYTACTGRRPFRSETVFGVIKKVCDSEPRPVREINSKIAPWLASLIEKLLKKDREDRFQSAMQVSEVLSQEIAHAQNPTMVAVPNREWIPQKVKIDSNRGNRVVFGALVGIAILAVASAAVWASGINSGSTIDPGTSLAGAMLTTQEQENEPPNSDDAMPTDSTASSSDETPLIGDEKSRCEESACSDSECDQTNDETANGESSDESTTVAATIGAAGKLVSIERECAGGIVDGYQIYLPVSYDNSPNRTYPVIMSLAGGCYVGGKIEDLACWGMPEEIDGLLEKLDEIDMAKDERAQLILDTFIVVSPHMIAGDYDDRQFYDQTEAITEILDEVNSKYRANRNMTYLTGAGRGGHGAWGLASRMPERFAAVVPIRGYRSGIKDYKPLIDMPIWVGHCLDDTEINYGESAAIVRRIEKEGKKFEVIELEEPDDDAYLSHRKLFSSYPGKDWPNLYTGMAMYKWMLTHQK